MTSSTPRSPKPPSRAAIATRAITMVERHGELALDAIQQEMNAAAGRRDWTGIQEWSRVRRCILRREYLKFLPRAAE